MSCNSLSNHLHRCASTPLWKVMEKLWNFISRLQWEPCLSLIRVYFGPPQTVTCASLSSHICTPNLTTVPFSLSFSTASRLSIVSLGATVLVCSSRCNFSACPQLCRKANNDLFTAYSWKRNDKVLPVTLCACLCVHAARPGPLRALCLPVSPGYWCHMSPRAPHHSCRSGVRV